MKKFLLIVCLTFSSLSAEILTVQLIWNPGNCTAQCAAMLVQRFQQIPGAMNVAADPNTGSASMSWAPGVPLNFSPINAAFSLVGPSIQDMRVIVRGQLIPQGNTFILSSIGDNTPFLLLGTLIQQPGQFTTPYSYNPVNYPLSPELLQQLSILAQQGQPVTVSGEILAPERSPPWMLIVRNVQVAAAPAPQVAPGYGYPGQVMLPGPVFPLKEFSGLNLFSVSNPFSCSDKF